jgi:hypothetical protein
MISFRQKKTIITDMMPKALEFFDASGIKVNKISPEQADAASKVNSKSMVLVSFILNDHGNYQISVQDKELYRYTQKLLKDIFRLNIISIDTTKRIITAECEHEGIIYDILEILGRKYNLSVVC